MKEAAEKTGKSQQKIGRKRGKKENGCIDIKTKKKGQNKRIKKSLSEDGKE